MDVLDKARRLIAQTADLITALRLGRDRLHAERDRARRACVDARALRPPSLHDLMPLDLAAGVIFRRVYSERMPVLTAPRSSAHLDGLAYAIADLAPIYVYEQSGGSVRQLSRQELDGGLFQNGAKTISYIDGRPALRDLALSVKHIEAIVQALLASADVRPADA
jgi:hypothetical protein